VENLIFVAKWVRSGQVARSGLALKEGKWVELVRRKPLEEATWNYK